MRGSGAEHHRDGTADPRRAWLLVAALALAACGASGDDGDAASDDGGDATGADADVGADADADAPGDTPTGGLQIGCYELEWAINTDAAAGETILRWYGGFYEPPAGPPVTNLSVTGLEVHDGPTVFTMTDAALIGADPIDVLPAVQREVVGRVTAATADRDLCVSSGPTLHRGRPAGADLRIELTGTSDQGPWSAACDLGDDDVLVTCHTGISGLAEGYAFNDDFPGPPPMTGIDMTVVVRTRVAEDSTDVTVSSLVLHGEGSAETFTVPAAGGWPCSGPRPYDCVLLTYNDEGRLPEALCPDAATGWPIELFYVYAGTFAGRPFAGAAPADQCWYGEP